MKSTCFVFKLKRKKHSSLLKIWDFFHSWEKFSVFPLVPLRSTREKTEFLTLVEEIQRLSTRSATLHSWKDGISHTRGRNPRSSIGTRVRTYLSNFYSRSHFWSLGSWYPWENCYSMQKKRKSNQWSKLFGRQQLSRFCENKSICYCHKKKIKTNG